MTSEASEPLSDTAPPSQAENGAASGTQPGFLGWRIIGVGFLAQFLLTGTTLSIVGNLVTPLSTEYEVPPAFIGSGVGLAILLMGALGPFIGRAVDAGHVRWLLGAGSALTGLGLILTAQAQTFGQVAAAFLFFGCIGGALFGALPVMGMTSNWFVRKRGLALGLVVSGATIASGIAPILAGWMIENEGWRATLSTFGWAPLLASPLFIALAIARPEEVGQKPDGILEALTGDETAEVVEAKTAAELAKDRRLWQQAVGFGLVLTSPVVLMPTLVPFAEAELGLTQARAGFFFLVAAPFSLIGKIGIGMLADVAPLKPAIAAVVVLNAIVWILLGTQPSYSFLLVIGAIYGLGIGGVAPLHGVFIGRLFGRIDYGTASGLGGIVGVVLIALASFGSQALLAATGAYGAIFVVQTALLVLGGLILLPVPVPSAAEAR